MRYLAVAVATTLLILSGCGNGDAENRAATAEAQAQQLRNENNALQAQLTTTHQQRDAAQSLAEQRKAAANTIASFSLKLVLHLTALPGVSADLMRHRFGAGLRLERSDGSAVTLAETWQALEASGSGAQPYQLTSRFSPDEPQQVMAQPITSLQNVTSATSRYELLLGRAGLTLANGGTADVSLTINGFEVFSATTLPVTVGSGGTMHIQLDPYFSNLFDRYTSAVQRKSGGA